MSNATEIDPQDVYSVMYMTLFGKDQTPEDIRLAFWTDDLADWEVVDTCV